MDPAVASAFFAALAVAIPAYFAYRSKALELALLKRQQEEKEEETDEERERRLERERREGWHAHNNLEQAIHWFLLLPGNEKCFRTWMSTKEELLQRAEAQRQAGKGPEEGKE